MVEYVYPQEDTQTILKSLTLTLLMQVAREYKTTYSSEDNLPLSEQIVRYINEHTDAVSLKDRAAYGAGRYPAQRHRSFRRGNHRHAGIQQQQQFL